MDSSKTEVTPVFFHRLFLPGILLLAFLIRFWGVNFGLPNLYHADEPIVVNHALAYGSGNLDPHFFKIPPLLSYLLFVCYGIYYLVGRVLGIFASLHDFEYLFYFAPASFYLIARVVFGVLLGTLAVFLLYRLANRLLKKPWVLFASLCLAVNFLHARDSHYVYADIPLVCVLLAGMSVILNPPKAGEGSKQRSFSPFGFRMAAFTLWHVLVGTMIGLATAVKYNGIFLAIPYLWITLRSLLFKVMYKFRHSEDLPQYGGDEEFQRHGPSPSLGFRMTGENTRMAVVLGECLRGWGMAGLAAVLVFILLNPYSVLDVRFFLKDILEQSAANRGGMPSWHYLTYSLMGAFTSVSLLLGIFGFFRWLFSSDLQRQSIAVFILGYYLVLLKWGQPYDRYVLPLIPFLCLAIADVLEVCYSRLCSGRGDLKHLGRVLCIGLAVICVLPPLAKIVRWDWLMSQTDTRTLAKNWIEENLPTDSAIAIDREFHGPRLNFSVSQLRDKLSKAGKVQARRVHAYIDVPGEPSYRLFFPVDDISAPRFLFAEPVVPRDVASIKKAGIRYVVTTPAGRASDEFILELGRQGRLIASFSPYESGSLNAIYDPFILTGGPFLWQDILARERNGYPILIYALSDAVTNSSS